MIGLFKMLTRLETKFMNYSYTVCCRYDVLPFTWTGKKLMLKGNRSMFFTVWNCIVWLILSSVLMFQIKQLRDMLKVMDVNGSILNATLIVIRFAHFLHKFNTRMYKTDLLEVNNQVLQINSKWGKYNKIL